MGTDVNNFNDLLDELIESRRERPIVPKHQPELLLHADGATVQRYLSLMLAIEWEESLPEENKSLSRRGKLTDILSTASRLENFLRTGSRY